ncbi:hypothetical protein K8I28_02595 [bacterium]|nr:hypothetical protein [bacterium]
MKRSLLVVFTLALIFVIPFNSAMCATHTLNMFTLNPLTQPQSTLFRVGIDISSSQIIHSSRPWLAQDNPGAASGDTMDEMEEEPFTTITLSGIHMGTDPGTVKYFSDEKWKYVKLEEAPLEMGAPSLEDESVQNLYDYPLFEYRMLTFKAKLPGYAPIEEKIAITPGEVRKISFSVGPDDLEQVPIWQAVLLPGIKQRFVGYEKRGWVFTAAQVASIVFGAYAYMDYRDKYDTFESAQDEYNSAVGQSDLTRTKRNLESTHSDMVSAGQMADIGFYTIGAVYTLNFMDITIGVGGRDRFMPDQLPTH